MSLKALVVGHNSALCRATRDALDCFLPIDNVALAATGREGLASAALSHYDVILVDIDIPDMKYTSLLKTLRLAQPTLRLIVTMDADHIGAPVVDELRRFGADSVVPRPTPKSSVRFLDGVREHLVRPRSVPARDPVRSHRSLLSSPASVRPMRPVQPLPETTARQAGDLWITAIAVSTGGPAALSELIPRLPSDYPHPILVVQHMPPIFTTALSKDLNSRSAVAVVEAGEGDILKAGTVYIAPGGRHMAVVQSGGSMRISLTDEPPENSCRPSADVMFRSLARIQGSGGVLAVVMTGMGSDGCEGVRILKGGQCRCLTQDEDSCAVYGMPRAVDEAGLSDEKVDLKQLHDRMAELALGREIVHS